MRHTVYIAQDVVERNIIHVYSEKELIKEAITYTNCQDEPMIINTVDDAIKVFDEVYTIYTEECDF